MPLDLKPFAKAEEFAKLCGRRKWPVYDLGPLEGTWKLLRDGERRLEGRHLSEIFDEKNTHFSNFWKKPAGVDRKLRMTTISLQLPKAEGPIAKDAKRKKLVSQLVGVLGSLDTVSVLLRCIHPTDFSVYSPPLLNFLQLPNDPHDGDPAKYYLSYCDEFKKWGKHFLGDDTDDAVAVADISQALWVFYECVYGPFPDNMRADALRRDFESDKWVRQQHAQNLLRAFFKYCNTPLDQADFLKDIDVSLAGKIAGCEFEDRVMYAVPRVPEDDRKAIIEQWKGRNQPGELAICIEYLARTRPLSTEEKKSFQRAGALRNSAVHNKHLNPHDVDVMIARCNKLEPRPKKLIEL